jgi:Spy/CpxP family protein refolding chaperone
MKNILIAVAALAAFGASDLSFAQATNVKDDTELLISQIQTDKRAVVLSAMDLTDAQVAAFTPIYDKYQADMKEQFASAVEMLNKFAANYGSMTDDAAKDILKDWFKLRDSRNATMKKYAKQMERELPATKVLQWVQIENKLNTLLDVQAASVVPVSR